tara:strand:+ start:1247 stop:1831 length:585 start_codon:yes stop_codon:yes gene_type:complete
MQKKTLLQLLILILIVGILFYIYQNYLLNQKKLASDNVANSKIVDFREDTPNLIHNIKYIAEDRDGSKYIITSKLGELNNDNPEIILMRDVTATIGLKNSKTVKIYSDIAEYNNINFNTKFYENVLMIHEEHVINSDNLDLMFEDSLIIISNNIIYKNLNTKMQADKIEIDLITKNSKIFMNDKFKKIKIINTN